MAKPEPTPDGIAKTARCDCAQAQVRIDRQRLRSDQNAQAEIAKNAPLYNYLDQERPIPVGYRGPRAFFGNLFKYARLLLRAVDERAKRNGERIPEFRDSALQSLELELFSNEPIYDDYEILPLTDSLTDLPKRF